MGFKNKIKVLCSLLLVSNGFRLDVVETLAYDSNIGREVRLNGNQTSVGVATTAL